MNRLREHLSDWGPLWFLIIGTAPILAWMVWRVFGLTKKCAHTDYERRVDESYNGCILCDNEVLRGNLTLAEEGLANYAKEVELLRDQRDTNLAKEVERIASLTTQRDEYKVLWERDSTALGKALNEVSSLRAGKEQFRAAIEQLHAAVKTAQELAATRLMEIDNLRAALQTIVDFSDSAMGDGDGARDVARAALGAHAHEPGACTSRESDWCCTHCGRDNDPSETHCVHCEWSRKHTVAGVLHERGCEDNPCRCGALKSQGASRDASSEKSSVERLGIIKQTPRQASVDDIEWLCEKVEQLQAGILYEVENASLAPSARIRMRTLASGTHESEKPGYHCGKLKADCDDEFCPTHGRDIR